MLDERGRRVWAAAEADALGYGGQSLVASATGLAQTTIHREGIRQAMDQRPPRDRIRRVWRWPQKTDGGPARIAVGPGGAGGPDDPRQSENPLRWTCLSTRQLAATSTAQGYRIGRQTVAHLLAELGYSLQGNCNTPKGPAIGIGTHKSIIFIAKFKRSRVGDNRRVGRHQEKEWVGDFKNGGQEWRLKGNPERVRTYDFVDKVLGKVNPYGVYDPVANVGWVSVGVDHDTAEFAVETLRLVGKNGTCTLSRRDGSAGDGRWWWQQRIAGSVVESAFQRLANETGLDHRGYSRQDEQVEQDRPSHVQPFSRNRRGKPLVSHEVIVNLFASTTTQTGLKIEAEMDHNLYPKGLRSRMRNSKKSACKKPTSTVNGTTPSCHQREIVAVIDGQALRRMVRNPVGGGLGRNHLGATLCAVGHQRRLPGVCHFPIVWKILPAGVKHPWKPEWLALLKALRGRVSSSWTVVVLADRGLYAKWLFEAINGLGGHPMLRVTIGGSFRPEGWYHWVPFRQWVATVGQRWQGRGTAFTQTKTRLNCTLLGCWEPGHDQPWLILTDVPPQAADACGYGLRPGSNKASNG